MSSLNRLRVCCAAGTLAVLGAAVVFAQQAVVVQVYQAGGTSPVYYEYRVVNGALKAVVRLIIGRDDYYNGNAELVAAPLGWNFDTGTNPGSLAQPAGWTATVETTEGSDLLEVQWVADNAGSYLAAGGTLYGLNVKVMSTDDTYRTGHWTAIFKDGSTASGILQAVKSTFVPGDINNDGLVNCDDLAVVRMSYGRRSSQPGVDPRADTNVDGIVDLRDLTFVSQRLAPGTKCQ